MASQIECPTCEGARVVASDNGKSWNQFRGKPYFSEEMTKVREGSVEPKPCPQCKGAGVIDSAPESNGPAPKPSK